MAERRKGRSKLTAKNGRIEVKHVADWGRFLGERHLLILEWVAEGKSFEEIRRTLSMDVVQVELISMTPAPKEADRYGWK